MTQRLSAADADHYFRGGPAPRDYDYERDRANYDSQTRRPDYDDEEYEDDRGTVQPQQQYADDRGARQPPPQYDDDRGTRQPDYPNYDGEESMIRQKQADSQPDRSKEVALNAQFGEAINAFWKNSRESRKPTQFSSVVTHPKSNAGYQRGRSANVQASPRPDGDYNAYGVAKPEYLRQYNQKSQKEQLSQSLSQNHHQPPSGKSQDKASEKFFFSKRRNDGRKASAEKTTSTEDPNKSLVPRILPPTENNPGHIDTVTVNVPPIYRVAKPNRIHQQAEEQRQFQQWHPAPFDHYMYDESETHSKGVPKPTRSVNYPSNEYGEIQKVPSKEGQRSAQRRKIASTEEQQPAESIDAAEKPVGGAPPGERKLSKSNDKRYDFYFANPENDETYDFYGTQNKKSVEEEFFNQATVPSPTAYPDLKRLESDDAWKADDSIPTKNAKVRTTEYKNQSSNVQSSQVEDPHYNGQENKQAESTNNQNVESAVEKQVGYVNEPIQRQPKRRGRRVKQKQY